MNTNTGKTTRASRSAKASKSEAVADDKKIQSQLGSIVNLFVYAAIEDIESGLTVKPPVGMKCSFQSYDNLLKERKHRLTVNSRFSISIPFKKMMCFILKSVFSEISSVPPGTTDVTSVLNILRSQQNPSYMAMASTISQGGHKKLFGQCLSGAIDVDGWVVVQMRRVLPKAHLDVSAMDTLAQEFIDFLRVISWFMSAHVYFNKGAINERGLLATLYQLRAPQRIIEALQPFVPLPKVKVEPEYVYDPANPPKPSYYIDEHEGEEGNLTEEENAKAAAEEIDDGVPEEEPGEIGGDGQSNTTAIVVSSATKNTVTLEEVKPDNTNFDV